MEDYNTKLEVLEKYFKQNHINPYRFIGISKRSSRKELKQCFIKRVKVLDPEKNQGEELELKILTRCFEYIDEKFKQSKAKDNEDKSSLYEPVKQKEIILKVKEETIPEDISRNFYRTNFDDPETRKKLFVNNSINLNDIGVTEKNPEIISESLDNPKKLMKRWNIKKFNKIFEDLKDDELDKPQELNPLDANSSLAPTTVSSYKGIMIENPEYDVLEFADFSKIKNELDVINKMKRKKGKKGKQGKNDLQEPEKIEVLANKRKSEKVEINTTRSFDQSISDMYEMQKRTVTDESNKNRDHILKNIHIFPKEIIDQFEKGILEDSSTNI